MKKNVVGGTTLRDRAVEILHGKSNFEAEASIGDREKLIEELRIHQIELELQNEDLRFAVGIAEQSRNKFLDLYESAPVGYLTLGISGEVIEANLTASRFLGLERLKLLKHRFTELVEPEYQDILYFHLMKVRQSFISESCELKLRRYGGDPFFAHLESLASRHDQEETEIRISFMNIHESKLNSIALKETANHNEMLLNLLPQSAMLIDKDRKVLAGNLLTKNNGAIIDDVWETLRQHKKTQFTEKHGSEGNSQQQRLVTVIEDSNDAVSLLDMNGKIMAWNRRAEEMYGYSAAEALKMSVLELVPFGLKQKTRQLLCDIRAGLVVKPFETKRISHDGTVLDVFLKITLIALGKKIVAIATTERDVTEHNRWFASLHDLPRRIIMAQEKERGRISQVLHSEFGQSLIALKLFTVMSAAAVEEKDQPMKTAFSSIRLQLDQIINDTRNLAHELSPPGLRYAGLVPAIKDLVETQMMKKNLEIRFFHKNIIRVCFKKIDIIIYRILQEALQNIFKHAQATRARVSAVIKNSMLILEISDNGRGFDQTLKNSAAGLGLALMKEQVALMRGRFSIESIPGKGTTIKVTVPIRKKKKT